MLALTDVNTRSPTCPKCKGTFRISLPNNDATIARLGGLLKSNPMEFIRLLRGATGAELGDAKGFMQHATVSASCHMCNATLPAERLADCAECRSLNIRLDALQVGG